MPNLSCLTRAVAVITALSFIPGLQSADFAKSVFKQVVNKVDVVDMPSLEESRAKKGETFEAPDLIKTGRKSRAQLVAEDGTITRVGSNSVFSYEPGSRTIKLEKGNVLFNTPSGKGGGTIVTATATATVLGTTIIVSSTSNGGFKLLNLEGSSRVNYSNGATRTVKAGQMAFVMPGGTPGPVVNFDLKAQVQGSSLVNGFSDKLPSQEKIDEAVEEQQEQIEEGKMESTGALVVGAVSESEISVVDTSLITQNTDSSEQNQTSSTSTTTTTTSTATEASSLLEAVSVDLTLADLSALPAANTLNGTFSFMLNDSNLYNSMFSVDDHTSSSSSSSSSSLEINPNTSLAYKGILANNLTISGLSSLGLGSFDGATVVLIGAKSTLSIKQNLKVSGLSSTRSLLISGSTLDTASGLTIEADFSGSSESLLTFAFLNATTLSEWIIKNTSGGVTFHNQGDLTITALTVEGSTGQGEVNVFSPAGTLTASGLILTGKTIEVDGQNGLTIDSSSGAVTLTGTTVEISSGATTMLTGSESRQITVNTPSSALTVLGKTIKVEQANFSNTSSISVGGYYATQNATTKTKSDLISLNSVTIPQSTSNSLTASTVVLANMNFNHSGKELIVNVDNFDGTFNTISVIPDINSPVTGQLNLLQNTVTCGGNTVSTNSDFASYCHHSVSFPSLPIEVVQNQ